MSAFIMTRTSSRPAPFLCHIIQFRSFNMYRAAAVATALLWGLWLQHGDAHVVTPGRCPEMQVKENFDVKKYMGTWFGYASFGTESTQGKGKCVTAKYSYNSFLRHVDIFNWQIPSPGYRGSINGSAVLINPVLRQGNLQVTFIISENVTKTFPLHILDTDYENWAVVYFCRNLLHHHETSGWILTRVQDLDNSLHRNSTLKQVKRVLKTASLKPSSYTKTIQNNCTKS